MNLSKIEKRWFIKKFSLISFTLIVAIMTFSYLGLGVQGLIVENPKNLEEITAIFIVIYPTLLGFLNGTLLIIKVISLLKSGAKEAYIKAQQVLETGNLTEQELELFKSKKSSITKKVITNPAVKINTDTNNRKIFYTEFRDRFFIPFELNPLLDGAMEHAWEIDDYKKVIEIIKSNWPTTQLNAIKFIEDNLIKPTTNKKK